MSLFERAAALVPPGELDLALETELGDALFWTGRGDDALRRADALAERASAAGDRVGELCGRIQGGVFRIDLEPEGATSKLAALVEQALPVFQAAGDDLALYIAYDALGEMAITRGQMRRSAGRLRAGRRPRPAGGPPTAWILGACALARFFGTDSRVGTARVARRERARHGRDHFLRAYRAGALAMLGRFDEARTILAEARAELAERGGGVLLANITAFESVWVELWPAIPPPRPSSEQKGAGCTRSWATRASCRTRPGRSAQALYALDRLDEADAWAGRAAELGASDDAWTQMLWRQVRAKVLARRGEHAEAEQLAREAVAIGEETDMLDATGRRVRRPRRGAPARWEARRRSRRARAGARALRAQGEPRVAQRARARLAELQDAAPR